MIKLGEKVKDVITGFNGIATAKTEWLNKCVRILITSQKLKEGKPVAEWFDEEQIEKISNGVISKKKEYTGGPKSHNPQRKDAKRI